jgi:hypothetical protein
VNGEAHGCLADAVVAGAQVLEARGAERPAQRTPRPQGIRAQVSR